GDIHRRQEVHLNLDEAVALALLAAAALHVEAETSRPIAADLRGGQAREQVAYLVEHAGVGRRVAARRAPDGRLVDDDDLVQALITVHLAVFARAVLR